MMQSMNKREEFIYYLPPNPELLNQPKIEITPIQISLRSIDEVPIKQGENTRFQLRITLYNPSYKTYFGNTWKSSVVESQPQKKLRIRIFDGLNLYFYTSFRNENVIAVLELCYALDELWLTVGWTILRLFKHDGSLRNNSFISIPLHYGTPQALYLMEEPFESNPLLQKIPGCTITYSVTFYDNLLKFISDKVLIPANTIFGTFNEIPGLSVDKESALTRNGKLLSPKLKNLESCTLNQIYVFLQSSIELFEQQLCNDVIKEYIKLVNGNASIIERRLKIGVHNGLCYVIEPHICQLVPYNSSVRGGVSEFQLLTPKSAKIYSNKALIHRNKVKLKKIPKDERMMIIFYVEYMLTVSSVVQKGNESTGIGSSRNVCVIIGWNQWKPFQHISNTEAVNIPLLDSPSQNPNHNFIYMNEDQNDLKFTCLFSNRENSTETPRKVERLTSKSQIISNEINGASEEKVVSKQPTARSLPSLLPSTPHIGKQHSLDSIINSRHRMHNKEEYDHSPKTKQYQKIPDETDTTPRELKMMHPQSQPLSPHIANVPKAQPRKQMFSKRILSKLNEVGFKKIIDQHNNIPETIDPSVNFVFDMSKEAADLFKMNEIIFQFTALSFCSTYQKKYHLPSSVILSFQFYYYEPFCERLKISLMEDFSSDDNVVSYLLYKYDHSNSQASSSPGLQIRYSVDAFNRDFLPHREFFAYLCDKPLHIDIWDGESQLHLGCCSVNLKSLCRQGRPSIQIRNGYNITCTEYLQAVPHLFKPHQSKRTFLGQLYLQMTNIGGLGKNKDFQDIMQDILYDYNRRETDASLGGIIKARSMVEVDEHLAEALARVTKFNISSDSQQLKEQHRKLQRMELIRLRQQSNSSPDKKNISSKNSDLQAKLQRLHIIQAYQEKCKRQAILALLQRSVKTEKRINAIVGSVTFFEFPLRNPYNGRTDATIDIQAPSLNVIEDSEEWLYLKDLNNKSGSVKAKMISRNMMNGLPYVSLQPEEIVFIPFKYLSYSCTRKSISMIHHHTSKRERFDDLLHENSIMESKLMQVSFKTQEDLLIALLNLHVQVWPPFANETFHFYQKENSFLKQTICLNSVNNLTGPGKRLQLIHCSDDHVSFDMNVSDDRAIVDVAFKVEVGTYGTRKEFYFLFYDDYKAVSPFFVWKILVDSLQAIDVSCTQGQTHSFTLLIRGLSISKNIHCFSCNKELNIKPSEPFELKANSTLELSCTLTSSESGLRVMYVNGIDTDNGKVLYSWLINIICQPPIISRVFQVELPQQLVKQITKKIYFTNPYPEHKVFSLHTSVPELLYLPDTQINLAPYEKQRIVLIFLPYKMMSKWPEILIFINNEKGGNEETIGIQIS